LVVSVVAKRQRIGRSVRSVRPSTASIIKEETVLRDNPRPTSDFVFRKLFGSEENKDLLISLINAVIQPMVPIVDVIKNPFNMASYDGAKESILDIKAVDENGVWYDIEMPLTVDALSGRGRRITSYPSSLR